MLRDDCFFVRGSKFWSDGHDENVDVNRWGCQPLGESTAGGVLMGDIKYPQTRNVFILQKYLQGPELDATILRHLSPFKVMLGPVSPRPISTF